MANGVPAGWAGLLGLTWVLGINSKIWKFKRGLLAIELVGRSKIVLGNCFGFAMRKQRRFYFSVCGLKKWHVCSGHSEKVELMQQWLRYMHPGSGAWTAYSATLGIYLTTLPLTSMSPWDHEHLCRVVASRVLITLHWQSHELGLMKLSRASM